LPDSIDDVQLHLAETFPDIANSTYFEDFARIGSYLSDPQQYRHGLELLHADMETRFAENLKPYVRGIRKKFPQLDETLLRAKLAGIYIDIAKKRTGIDRSRTTLRTIAIRAFSKILSDSLKANELKNGFHLGASDQKPDILIGFPEVVNGKIEFNNFLREKKVFKDLSAGKEHGEFSHRIQWYLISKLGTLAHPVADIYSRLPPFRTPKTHTRSFYLWESLVDRDGVVPNAPIIPFKTQEETDFRAPSNLNRCLCKGNVFPQFDLLIAVLNERWDRRDDYMMDAYLGKKEGLGTDLDPQTLDELRELVLPGGEKRIFYR